MIGPLEFSEVSNSNIEEEKKVSLPEMMLSEHVVHDYAATSLSLKAHPVSFVREKLQSASYYINCRTCSFARW